MFFIYPMNPILISWNCPIKLTEVSKWKENYLICLVSLLYCTEGWVNFSDFEITVCGSCKM